MDEPNTSGTDRSNEAAPYIPVPCQCEAEKHFSQAPDNPASIGHRYLSVPAGNHTISYVGPVCDECARECYWESPRYVWIREAGMQSGTITDLVHEIETTYYSGDMTPDHVLTVHDNAWVPVTVTNQRTGCDDNDFIHYELTCSWADRNESIGYRIDGRA